MKLYYSKGACSLAVRITIEELGKNASFISVDLKSKKTESGEDFLAINPKGAVPVLMLDNNEILTENAVILQYLADSNKAYNLLPEIGDFTRYRVLEWVNYITTELHKTFGTLFNQDLSDEVKKEIFIPLLLKKFAYVNKNMKGNYLMGDNYSLPDAYLFVILSWAYHFKIDVQPCEKLSNFYKTMQQRAAVKKALEDEGLTIK